MTALHENAKPDLDTELNRLREVLDENISIGLEAQAVLSAAFGAKRPVRTRKQ